jgi:hypothetical protein
VQLFGKPVELAEVLVEMGQLSLPLADVYAQELSYVLV